MYRHAPGGRSLGRFGPVGQCDPTDFSRFGCLNPDDFGLFEGQNKAPLALSADT